MTTLIEQRSLNRNLTFAYRGIYTTRNQEVKTVQKASKKGLAKNKTLSFTNADKYMGHTSTKLCSFRCYVRHGRLNNFEQAISETNL